MDSVLQLVEVVMTSPWLYLVVAADSVLPVFPGEMVVITAAAYAVGQDQPSALLLLPVTVLAAVVGDVTSHHLGRGAGPRRRSSAGPSGGCTLAAGSSSSPPGSSPAVAPRPR